MREDKSIVMATCIKANSLKIKHKVLVLIGMLKEANMKESGKLINKKVKEKNPGLIRANIQEDTRTA